jgi:hypothetical protein
MHEMDDGWMAEIADRQVNDGASERPGESLPNLATDHHPNPSPVQPSTGLTIHEFNDHEAGPVRRLV